MTARREIPDEKAIVLTLSNVLVSEASLSRISNVYYFLHASKHLAIVVDDSLFLRFRKIIGR